MRPVLVDAAGGVLEIVCFGRGTCILLLPLSRHHHSLWHFLVSCLSLFFLISLSLLAVRACVCFLVVAHPVEYAQVLRMLGNGRCESACFDSVKRLCHIRGKLRKKVWVNAGDIVLIGLREYQDEKADIILKYTADEARSLKQYGEIPDTTTIHENAEGGEGEDGEEGVVFEFDDIDEI